jgi:hypothetical protein
MSIIEKVWYVLHPNKIVMKQCHGWWDLYEKSLNKWHQLQHCKSIMSNFFNQFIFYLKNLYKGWQTLLGLYQVLVTLHGHITISMDQQKIKLVTIRANLDYGEVHQSKYIRGMEQYDWLRYGFLSDRVYTTSKTPLVNKWHDCQHDNNFC